MGNRQSQPDLAQSDCEGFLAGQKEAVVKTTFVVNYTDGPKDAAGKMQSKIDQQLQLCGDNRKMMIHTIVELVQTLRTNFGYSQYMVKLDNEVTELRLE